MLILEIGDKKLKKPLEVTISKTYIAENEDLELYGEGNTEESAIEDLKEVLLDIRDDLLSDEGFDNKDEYARKILDYFDEEELTPEEETFLIKKAIKKIT